MARPRAGSSNLPATPEAAALYSNRTRRGAIATIDQWAKYAEARSALSRPDAASRKLLAQLYLMRAFIAKGYAGNVFALAAGGGAGVQAIATAVTYEVSSVLPGGGAMKAVNIPGIVANPRLWATTGRQVNAELVREVAGWASARECMVVASPAEEDRRDYRKLGFEPIVGPGLGPSYMIYSGYDWEVPPTGEKFDLAELDI